MVLWEDRQIKLIFRVSSIALQRNTLKMQNWRVCVITDLYRDVMRSAQSEIVYSRYKYIWLLGLPSERHDFPDALCVFVEINLRSASTSRRASSSIWKLYSVVYRSVFRNGGLCITYVLHFFQINGLCSSSIHIVEEEGICVCIALWKCITL